MKKEVLKLYKIGKFYNAHGDDGYIIHELMGYKYVSYKQSVGFPEGALAKVKVKLEELKINYEIYNKDELIDSYKGINKNYNIVLTKALKNLETEKRIERLREKVNNCSKEKLEAIFEIIENELK